LVRLTLPNGSASPKAFAVDGVRPLESTTNSAPRVQAACSSAIAHHLLVDAEPPRAVHDQHVGVVRARVLERAARDIDRLLADRGGEELGLRLFRQHLELLDRRRAVDVAAREEHLLPVLELQPARELAGGGGLARALESREKDDGRRLNGEVQRVVLLAHQPDQLVVDHADRRLPRREAARDFLAQRALAHARDEIPDDGQRDVRFQQRHAHLAHGFLYVGW
jgi:hypothetical protein